jgi:hypothetical protein
MHLLFFPPDAFNDRWRVVDTISCWGTNINGKPVMTGKILALKHGDLLELAGKCPEFNESPLTVKFLDLAADESKYQALIVSNPEGDDSSRTARALRFKDELEKRYFSVRILSDKVKIEDLERELQLNAGACSQDATFLFAYTGHASEKGELCLHDGTYPKSRFFDGIGNFRSKNIIAIDGCFSSEFRRGNVPPRTTVITSTDGPQTSARGVLTEAIIQCFRQENGFISVDEGFRQRLIERGYFVRQTPGILERSVTVMQVRSRMAR